MDDIVQIWVLVKVIVKHKMSKRWLRRRPKRYARARAARKAA